MCKKNFIPISICFCVITLQIYREILKKNRKKAITLKKKLNLPGAKKQLFAKGYPNRIPNGREKREHIHTHTHTHFRIYISREDEPKKGKK